MKPSDLLSQEDIDRIKRKYESPEWPLKKIKSRVRALLCPVVGVKFYSINNSDVTLNMVKCDLSYMEFLPSIWGIYPAVSLWEYRPLRIGKGVENDVQLEKFGHCNYVSPRHAIIFYDRESNCFELLNYSEFGTKINNVLYSMNTGTTMPPQEVKEPTIFSIPTRGEEKGRKDKKLVTAPCNCGGNPPIAPLARSENPEDGCVEQDDQPVWEGSALLTNGCLIIFGCRAFVFSVID